MGLVQRSRFHHGVTLSCDFNQLIAVTKKGPQTSIMSLLEKLIAARVFFNPKKIFECMYRTCPDEVRYRTKSWEGTSVYDLLVVTPLSEEHVGG